MDMTAIAIVAIICWAIVSLSKNRSPSKKSKTVESQLQSEHAQMQKELDVMAERLAVLEKIVTDEKYQLNKELNSL
ncbi:MAG: flagellar motility protein MotE (MotC chaperone) [Alphaproteobacteria bacterium]|jgi:flagellar motility protein MotE (MotC chaperone)